MLSGRRGQKVNFSDLTLLLAARFELGAITSPCGGLLTDLVSVRELARARSRL